MTSAEGVLLVFVVLQTALVVVLLLRKRENVEGTLLEGLLRVQDRVQQDLGTLRVEVDRRLGESVTQNTQSFGQVAEQLGKLREAAGQIVTLSQGVNDLNVLLKKPQGRGSFGEMTLEQMLADLFGRDTGLYETQHLIEGGEKADAVIFLKADRSQMLCVDAKFPEANARPLLEGKGTPEIEKAFASDVRERAAEIRTKYIKPPKTVDFAFMFVPSEAVFTQLLKDGKLHQDLLRSRVVPTSPNSFYAYLQAVSFGWRQEKMAENAQKVAELGKELLDAVAIWAGHFSKLRSSVFDVVQKFNAVQGSMERNVFPKASRMKDLGVTTLKEIPAIEAVNEVPRAVELPEGK
jgi:DNA recombination protein RmuC